MTTKEKYHRYRRAGRCVECSAPSDYGRRCWKCARKHHGKPETVRERLVMVRDEILRELADTEALIRRLEGGCS